LSPWTFSTWDQDPGEITPRGTRRGDGGNPGARARLRFPRRSRDDQVGGFFEQSFQVTEDDATTGTVDFDWRVSNYPGTPPQSLEVFIYLDTVSGEPVPGTHIWSSGLLTSTTSWSTENVDIVSNISSQGTYYLKFAVWMVSITPRTNDNVDVSLDNISVYWEKRSIGYSSSNPTIEPTNSFAPTDVMAWNSFQEVATKNGGEIYYQLSDDNGNTWQYWNGSLWVLAGAANYNNAIDVNNNINSFSAINQEIKFKAFLASDGTQQVELDTIVITYDAVRSFNATYDVPADYSYDANDIEVVSSYAQLKNQGSVGSGGTTNSGFDTALAPWQYFDWDQGGGEVNVTGTRRGNGGNPGPYFRIRIPRGNNDEVGGYLQQDFQVTEDNPTSAILSFDGRVSSFSGNPITLEVYAFVDSAAGEPVIGTEVWSSGPITGTTGWTPISVDVTALLAAQDTYYFKLAAWIETGGQRAGRFDIRFDNVSVYWEKVTEQYPINNPTIQQVASFEPIDIDSWSSFQETAVKNGGEIYYQLSDNNGATWQYWSGSAWAIAGVADYNTAGVIDVNINSFSTTNKKIMFKAFLSSDGTQQVRLDNVSISYLISGSVGYYLIGIFESSTFDTGAASPIYNYIDWTTDEPAGTSIEWQLRTADTEANLLAAMWVGSDGTGGTYYTTPGELIELDPGAAGAQWIQYRAYLYSDSTSTPILKDITLDYEL